MHTGELLKRTHRIAHALHARTLKLGASEAARAAREVAARREAPGEGGGEGGAARDAVVRGGVEAAWWRDRLRLGAAAARTAAGDGEPRTVRRLSRRARRRRLGREGQRCPSLHTLGVGLSPGEGGAAHVGKEHRPRRNARRAVRMRRERRTGSPAAAAAARGTTRRCRSRAPAGRENANVSAGGGWARKPSQMAGRARVEVTAAVVSSRVLTLLLLARDCRRRGRD